MIESGVESSLAPANRKAEKWIEVESAIADSAKYKVLFDPQTCGGLLFGVRRDQAARFQQAAKTVGLAVPVEIGSVLDVRSGDCVLTVS